MFKRKEKEQEFYMDHMDTFRKLKIADPFFTIKTAFFQKGKFGRQSQFFEWELKKGEDIYIEFYDNVNNEKGKLVDIKPMNENRQLFKLAYNPYFAEEYDVKEGVNNEGETYKMYVVPVSEMTAVLNTGETISYSLYEKRLKEEEASLPRLQKTLTPSMFPDFEEEFGAKKDVGSDFDIDKINTSKPQSYEDVPLSEMTLRDLAAIMLMKPISNKYWLNEVVKQAKSEI